MEYLIAVAGCAVFPVLIGWLYGRNQEPPRIDPEFYYTWEDRN